MTPGELLRQLNSAQVLVLVAVVHDLEVAVNLSAVSQSLSLSLSLLDVCQSAQQQLRQPAISINPFYIYTC